MALPDPERVSSRRQGLLAGRRLARLATGQPALLRHFGSTGLRVDVARLRNSPRPTAWPRHGSDSPRHPSSPCGTGGPPRLAKSRCPRLSDPRSRPPYPTASPSGHGSRDLAGEARWCVTRRPVRGPAAQGRDNPGLGGLEDPRWRMGGAAAGQPQLQQRGKACAERKSLPGQYQISPTQFHKEPKKNK